MSATSGVPAGGRGRHNGSFLMHRAGLVACANRKTGSRAGSWYTRGQGTTRPPPKQEHRTPCVVMCPVNEQAVVNHSFDEHRPERIWMHTGPRYPSGHGSAHREEASGASAPFGVVGSGERCVVCLGDYLRSSITCDEMQQVSLIRLLDRYATVSVENSW
jgi:hypothetical protein